MKSSRRVLTLLLAATVSAASLGGARAAVTIVGDVDPLDPAAWKFTMYGYVGKTGEGGLTVDSGSMIDCYFGYVGYESTADGTATITGTKSSWSSYESLYVGHSGHATLTVADGANLRAGHGYIGYNAGSLGEATLSGESQWLNSTDLYVGYSGQGTLAITSGADVAHSDPGYVGYNAGSTGSVSVGGGGSTWSPGDRLHVGYYGEGTLAIHDGGTVTSGVGFIGQFAGATGRVTVEDDGSILDNLANLEVGFFGEGTLEVRGGGDIRTRDAFVGHNPGSTGNVTVRGSGSTWTMNPGILEVGGRGHGTVTISEGGAASVVACSAAYESGSTGEITVSGGESTLTCSGNLDIGYRGNGTLTIDHGGSVTAGRGTYVAYESTATGAIHFGEGGGTLSTRSLCVSPTQMTGAGAVSTKGLVSDVGLVFDLPGSLAQTLTLKSQTGQDVTVELDMTGGAGVNGDLGAGWKGTGSLDIQNGVVVDSLSGYLAFHTGSTARATVTSNGSTWNTSSGLYIGCRGDATLTISDGAVVNSGDDGDVATDSGSTGKVTVTGAGSRWLVNDAIGVGGRGDGTLAVTAGATVANGGFGGVGLDPGSTGYANVDGDGSSWTIGGDFDLGWRSHGTLEVTGGGTVSNGVCRIACYEGVAADATVRGEGSTWTNSGYLYVGYKGDATLVIADGATVSDTIGIVGFEYGATGRVTVSGASSIWMNSSSLYVGHFGTGAILIRDGGAADCDFCQIDGEAELASELAVLGAGSRLTNLGECRVGNTEKGMLTIRRGGAVSNTNGIIANYSDSTGLVTIEGSSSTWTNSGTLLVGHNGTGTLNVASGAQVTATSASINSKSRLAIAVDGGSRLDLGGGTITNNGTLRLIAGASPAAGGTFTPILASSWAGSGSLQTLGGTWDALDGEFTASAVQSGTSGDPVAIDLSQKQRVLVSHASTGWSIGASFLAMVDPTPLTFTAAAITGDPLGGLTTRLSANEAVVGAWDLSADSGYTAGDPVYLSFSAAIGQYGSEDLQVWRFDGADWAEYTADDLAWDGAYASFTVTGFSGYAVTVAWIPGDIDKDHDVDDQDAAVLAAHWGQSGDWWDGDFSGDGMVNAADASILAANWRPAVAGEAGCPTGSVPEPGVIAVLLGLGLVTLRCGRQRASRRGV